MIADDNRRRRDLTGRAPGSRRDRSAARPSTWVGCSARPWPARTTSPGPASADAFERVKRLPATCGHEGTTLTFGHYDHGALHGDYLVLRTWVDGRSVQVTD